MDYKLLLIVPLLLLFGSIAILVNGYVQTGEWFERSIELRGGTLITVNTDEQQDINSIEKQLSEEFGAVIVKGLRGIGGYGIQIEVGSDADSSRILEILSEYMDTSKSSIESIEPALGETFWNQAQLGIILAFIFMGIIVFAIFRSFVPSFAVILAAVSDILVTLTLMQVFKIELTLAGLASLLMLIGYSIDTDIMLTTRLLKRAGNLKENINSAFKTGITMTGTTLGALAVIYIVPTSPVITEIASILLIGLVIDVIMTWLQNSVLLRWYVERRNVIC
ncbi:MAG: protein translocase subunit SecF [Candidatus Aenigmarchaeota archaeon]|nr:protein translocase subunit SecF [Candidatus Aenigmarchaeota archaeon]